MKQLDEKTRQQEARNKASKEKGAWRARHALLAFLHPNGTPADDTRHLRGTRARVRAKVSKEQRQEHTDAN